MSTIGRQCDSSSVEGSPVTAWPGHAAIMSEISCARLWGCKPPAATGESEHRTTNRAIRERQKQTRLTASEIDHLLATRATGATIVQLAAQFDIHRPTVMAHLKRNKPLPHPSR